VGKKRWGRRAIVAAVVAVVVAAAAWGLLTILGGPAYERLAVLPPTSLMNDPEQAYFVQGVHNALITELQRAGIAVIARTSVMQYENTQTPIREIASELDVDALIEASVFRAGDSVEIQVSVVDGRTQQYVGDRITRRSDLRNVEGLYRGLTAAIASEIQLALTPQTEAHLASARPVNPQVYDAYLKGQFHWHRATPTDINQALEYFQQALSLDSTYAPAQAGIALVWFGWGQLALATPREVAAHASEAYRKALALDSTLAEVQYAAGLIRVWQEWDWAGGEAAFRKAIEINPNYAYARAVYAAFLAIMERPEEARAQMDRALELDPFNPVSRTMNGVVLVYERRYAESIEELEVLVRIEPDNLAAVGNLGWAYHLNGDYDEALAMVRMFFPGDQELDEALDRGYAEGGYRAALLRYAETLAARPEAADQLCIRVANTFAWAGDLEQTLEWFAIAYQAHDPNLPNNLLLTAHPMLHDDPRYHDLRRRVGLPER